MTPGTALAGEWLLWVVSWMAAALWSDRTVKHPGIFPQVRYRLIAAAGTMLLFGIHPRSSSSQLLVWQAPDALAWLAAVLAAFGFLFTWWARIHLGRLWSSGVTRKADHHVIDTGPYAWVRHPIYTGLLWSVWLTALARQTVAALIGATLLTISFYIKARLEERFLREQLGEAAYDSYAQRVPMIVPKLGSLKSQVSRARPE